jgi:hypothetical protein
VPYVEGAVEAANTANENAILGALVEDVPMTFEDIQDKTPGFELEVEDFRRLVNRGLITVHKKKNKFFYLTPTPGE